MDARLVPLLGGTLLVCVLPGCEGDLQNCPPVERSSNSNPYELDYELTIPAKCPVPLGFPGETKTAGARIFDNGERNFAYADVQVQNSDRKLLVSRLFRFVSDGTRYGAVPRTDYKAGTGSHGVTDLNKKFDYGIFAVTNNSQMSQPGDPFGQVQVTYQASGMNASVSGPTIPLGNTTQTWSANVSGGISPFAYNWYRNGAWVGGGPSYTGPTGTQDFNLLAEVTDAAMVVRNAVVPVDVDGVLVSISGPYEVYYSSGGGMWAASGEGGSPPYDFDWYVNDQWVGSGESWSGYPGAGNRNLGVRVRDASGSSHFTSREIIGTGDDTCAPEPPALKC